MEDDSRPTGLHAEHRNLVGLAAGGGADLALAHIAAHKAPSVVATAAGVYLRAARMGKSAVQRSWACAT